LGGGGVGSLPLAGMQYRLEGLILMYGWVLACSPSGNAEMRKCGAGNATKFLHEIICKINLITMVISVIFLIGTFVSSAGYLILIGINFVGISYIIVYVGAIAVLFLFVIMMINIKLTDILETGSQYTKTLPLALAVGSLFIFIIFSIIKINFNNVPVLSFLFNIITFLNDMFQNTYYPIKINFIYSIENNLYSSSSDSLVTTLQQIEVLGHSLYTYGAVLLITLSIILLLAMFATIIISATA